MFNYLGVFVFIILLFVSVSASFDDVQASKREARESANPGKPYHLYIISPFDKDFDYHPSSKRK